MPEQNRPASPKQAPDPANTYERTDPKKESGQGRLDNNSKATPTPRPDHISQAVSNAHAGDKQLNSQEAASINPQHADQSKEGESLGWEKPKAKP